MRAQEKGFTLIELIAVIVILGVIAAVAAPRFVDLSNAAREATVRALAGSLTSASALNYAAGIVALADLDGATSPSVVGSCPDAENLLEGGLPSGYAIESLPGESGNVSGGGYVTCLLVSEIDNNFAAEFGLYGFDPNP